MTDLKKEISELFVKYGMHTNQVLINSIVERIELERKKTLEEVREEFWLEYDRAMIKFSPDRKGERPRILVIEIIEDMLSKITKRNE